MKTLQSPTLSERKKKKIQKQIEKSLHTLQHDRNNYKLHIEIADSYSLLEDLQQAETYYISAIDLLRQTPDTEKTRKQIIMLYGKILDINPGKSEAYKGLGEEYMAIGQKEKAFRFLLSSAKKAFEDEEYELALQCYNQVIEMGKSNPYIVERCTELYLKLGRKQEAVDNYIRIGDMYAQEEKYIEALGYYKKASAIDLEVPELFLKTSRMYLAMEWTENAAAELVKAAEYHEHHQNYREASQYYQESLKLDPENEKALVGQQRVTEAHTIEAPEGEAEVPEEQPERDVLEALDHIEETLEMRYEAADFPQMKAPIVNLSEELPDEKDKQLPQEFPDEPIIDLTEEMLEEEHEHAAPEPLDNQIIDLTEELADEEHDRSQEEFLNNDVIDLTEEMAEEEPDLSAQEPPTTQESPSSSSQVSLKEFLFDPNKETLIFQEALDEQEFPPTETDVGREHPGVSGEDQGKEFYSEDLYETFQPDTSTEVIQTGESEVKANTEIEYISEDSLHELPDESEAQEFTPPSLQTTEEQTGVIDEGKAQEVQAPQAEEGLTPSEIQPEEAEEELIPPEIQPEEAEEELTPSEIRPEDRELAPPEIQSADEELSQPDLQHKEEAVTDFELQHKVEELEKQLENTQEEKYFLQEQFTAQIGELKTREADIQKQFDSVSQEREELQQRLERITGTYRTEREILSEFDETRYEAVIAKIQQKKQLLKQHLDLLLKQREENGRLLTEELKNLGATKERLKTNLEYIQQVKARIEEKVNTELQQARNEAQSLKRSAEELEHKLQDQQQIEKELREQFDFLSREKATLEEQFTETISVLTGENERLGHQLQELEEDKAQTEKRMKKKFHTLHTSYQKLKIEYKKSLKTKEKELNDTAQSLSEFVDKYVKLEKTLGEIRKERDKLDKMLARETATREMLEEKLVNIEAQIDSLEVQGNELIEQLGQELDRRFKIEHSISDEFQMSLEELEGLLVLQEKEIRSLETI